MKFERSNVEKTLRHLVIAFPDRSDLQNSSIVILLIGEKVNIYAAIRNRIWRSEIGSRVEEKRDE